MATLDSPRVSEAGYVSDTRGPAVDTETYYASTPAPGERIFGHEPPPTPASTREADRLELRGSVRRPAAHGGTREVPWAWVVGGLAVIGFLGLGGVALGLALTMGDGGTPDAPAEDPTWEGLKVKKGLR